jgi:uncharacterized Fe-S radical SAM superfamily protein PflX
VNQTFQLQIEAIRSVDDYTKDNVESIIKQKKAQLKNSKDIHESERLFDELDGLEWLQRPDRKIFLTIRKYKQQTQINRCSICGIKLDFDRISEYPLTCWQFMIIDENF